MTIQRSFYERRAPTNDHAPKLPATAPIQDAAPDLDAASRERRNRM